MSYFYFVYYKQLAISDSLYPCYIAGAKLIKKDE